ncbi:MAG: SYNERG-CTERM sorting domain-containing protein [Synergistaceae bacterium]|nr:SYNERG-CTERM sorting domain-containing protein [Synergistaceae bacterium]
MSKKLSLAVLVLAVLFVQSVCGMAMAGVSSDLKIVNDSMALTYNGTDNFTDLNILANASDPLWLLPPPPAVPFLKGITASGDLTTEGVWEFLSIANSYTLAGAVIDVTTSAPPPGEIVDGAHVSPNLGSDWDTLWSAFAAMSGNIIFNITLFGFDATDANTSALAEIFSEKGVEINSLTLANGAEFKFPPDGLILGTLVVDGESIVDLSDTDEDELLLVTPDFEAGTTIIFPKNVTAAQIAEFLKEWFDPAEVPADLVIKDTDGNDLSRKVYKALNPGGGGGCDSFGFGLLALIFAVPLVLKKKRD